MSGRSESSPGELADRTLEIQRLFGAPREQVFAAWTDPLQITQWWGPKGFTTTTLEMEVKPGGRWRFIMHAPDGTDYDNRITYLEVIRPEKLFYEHGTDKDDDPDRFHTTVNFTEKDGGTLVTLSTVLATVEQCEAKKRFGAVELGYETLECLAEHLAKMSANLQPQ